MEKKLQKKLSIVLPTFNEEENIKRIYHRLLDSLNIINLDYEIIFVDDVSSDGTISEINDICKIDHRVKYLLMSRRFGEQISLVAGLDYAMGDAVITMDSDLQHPPEYIPNMVEKWKKGSDVIIMQRESAGHNNFLKKIMEILFYKVINNLSNSNFYYRFSGFALLDKKVVNSIRMFKESEPFLRGLISIAGFRHSIIKYKEESRKVGESKYSFLRQLVLAVSGITSFSEKPLYLALYTGIFSVSLSFVYACVVIYRVLLGSNFEVDGWVSLIIAIIFFGGLQLLTIGILGIYIGKVFIETKKRPRYIIDKSVGFE